MRRWPGRRCTGSGRRWCRRSPAPSRWTAPGPWPRARKR
jgi:hypothetical protein